MPVESASRCLQLHSLFDPTLSNLVPREWPVKDGPGLEPTVPRHHLLQNLPTCSAPCREWLVPGPKMAKDLFIKDCLRSGKRKTQFRTQALFTRLDHKRLVTSCVTVLPSFKMWFLWRSLQFVFSYSFQASAYVAQVYDSVLAYAHALTSLHEAGAINKVTAPRSAKIFNKSIRGVKAPPPQFSQWHSY